MNYLKTLWQFLKFLFLGINNDGLMGDFEKSKIFSSSNKGLLLNGKNTRLSEKDSFNHLALISRTGGGKTTSFVLPNIFNLAIQNCSMVITDISGEIYEKTSGLLELWGFDIKVLNPEDLDESIRYNPYHNIKTSVDIDELVTMLIKSANEGESKAGFWESGAKTVLFVFTKYLFIKKIKKFFNLANTKHLINHFGSDGEALKHLFEEIDDEKLKSEFKALSEINSNTLSSILATANIALNPIAINDNLEKLMASNNFEFMDLRKKKTVLYIKIPGQKQNQYSFLLNIFYQQFFNSMMSELPKANDLPIYCLLDEFGNMSLPNFDTTITTIRKYKVSISIILQNIKQLESKYGKAKAETILNGGIASKLFYSGADLDTTQMLSRVLGENENKAIMKSHEIRTMKDNEGLFIMANKLPLRLKIKPYFKNINFNKFSKIKRIGSNLSSYDDKIEYMILKKKG